jgi:hypothetical protein
MSITLDDWHKEFKKITGEYIENQHFFTPFYYTDKEGFFKYVSDDAQLEAYRKLGGEDICEWEHYEESNKYRIDFQLLQILKQLLIKQGE